MIIPANIFIQYADKCPNFAINAIYVHVCLMAVSKFNDSTIDGKSAHKISALGKSLATRSYVNAYYSYVN